MDDDDEYMILHKIPHSVDYHHWLKRFDTQHNEPSNEIKSPLSCGANE